METIIDSSLEIQSAPPMTKRSPRKAKQYKRKKHDNHIDELVINALQDFYSAGNNADILWKEIGDEKNKERISLRIYDWFVTNYSKKHKTSFKVDKKTNSHASSVCMVWFEYKQKLKGYSKSRFDPFCRHSRIKFHLGKNRSIITTVGQLNFFRWAIERDILTYVREHKHQIEKDMSLTFEAHYSDRSRPDIKVKHSTEEKQRKKRKEICKVAGNGICVFKLT